MLATIARRLSLRFLPLSFLCWVVLLGGTSNLEAQDAKPADAAASSPESKAQESVPLKKVLMFTSGVGYFEHQGEVDGNAKVELRFNVDDINDLLKSMILEDRGGGKISTVTYDSRDPITKTLKTFPIDLTNNPTLADILNQVRGERVQVDSPTAITGTLLGVEKRRKEVGENKSVEVELLNLLTDDGMRSLPMESIGRIKLLNPQLDKDFHQALAVLATGHNNDKKSVTLDFLGSGKRPVRVGYIQETPVWKTSYRLVLDEAGKPFLQGWAIVENTSEEDWNDVQLTLVSGRPISYRMDLYEPLYAERPLEQLELYASLRPQVYGQDLSESKVSEEKLARARNMAESRRSGKARSGMGGMGGGMFGQPTEAAPAASPTPPAYADSDAAYPVADLVVPLSGSAAQAGEVGELFQYAIETPVNLPRQKSAMLPIVNGTVEGEKLSIYNPAVQPKHPLNGLRLVNSTNLHLMQGPITVFDGATYAGDAKIEDLAPGAERLLSYALDLKTEVAPESKGHPDQVVSIKLVKGALQVTRKFVRETNYTVKNSDDKAKTVLIEQPFDASWKLVAPQEPTEKTRDLYRFAMKVEPGKPTKLAVIEEQVVQETLALSNLDDGAIVYFSNQKTDSPEVKAALLDVIKRKQSLQQVVQQREQLAARIAEITGEQERIRQNMGQLDRNSELYRRYVQKFGDQETAVEKMRADIEKLTAEEVRLRTSLDEHLLNLTL
jgi:hypothetical protein